MWPVDDIFILSGVNTSLCLDTVSARIGVGRAFAVAGPTAWNSLSSFRRLLKTRLFSEYFSTSTYSALEVSHFMRYIYLLITYLLTYDLSPRFLLHIKEQISYPLFLIFRKSLDEGVVPEDWKLSNVSPIYNKKAVLPQGNRAMPQVFFSVEVRQQHSLQV